MREVPVSGGRAASPIADAVARGLLAHPKCLPPYLFYDARGSALFEAITHLPEYYPTRTERAIFEIHADAILGAACRAATAPSVMIELGAGTATKSQILLTSLVKRQGPAVFVPVDVSAEPLAACASRLAAELPLACVQPIVAHHEDALRTLGGASASRADRPEHRIVLFIGSSIGNLDDGAAIALLRAARESMAPGDALILGADRKKDIPTLLAAYDDAAGVTAAFNRNLLVRINRELGGHFDLVRFAHRAVWNEAVSRIEMHLVSEVSQRVRIDGLGLDIAFRAGETIHTESSAKYDDARVRRILAAAGFARPTDFIDDRGWFGVHVALAS